MEKTDFYTYSQERQKKVSVETADTPRYIYGFQIHDSQKLDIGTKEIRATDQTHIITGYNPHQISVGNIVTLNYHTRRMHTPFIVREIVFENKKDYPYETFDYKQQFGMVLESLNDSTNSRIVCGALHVSSNEIKSRIKYEQTVSYVDKTIDNIRNGSVTINSIAHSRNKSGSAKEMGILSDVYIADLFTIKPPELVAITI